MAGRKTRTRPEGRLDPDGQAETGPDDEPRADGAGAAAMARCIIDQRGEIEAQMPRLWAQRCVRTESGRPLDFTDRPWLAQIYDDPSPRTVVQKAAQVGATTLAIAKALHGASLLGQTVVYTMPVETDVRDLVSGRVNPIIDRSLDLKALAARGRSGGNRAPVDNAGLKRLGLGAIYFRGTQSERAATSVPAHMVINDEVDFSSPQILAQYEHRLDALPPNERRTLKLSTPSVGGFGINAAFEASDASEWLVRCAGCGWQGPLDYWEHTRGELPYLACARCGGKLDPRQGEWVARHPGRDVRGFHVSRLMVALPERPDVLTALHEERLSTRYLYQFFTMQLGVPSEEGTERITSEQILAACFTEAYPMTLYPGIADGPYYMGVDQGDTLTVVVVRANPARDEGKLRVVYLARLRDPGRGSAAWDQVRDLIKHFGVLKCVVDGNPNSANAHDLASAFPGVVEICYYREAQPTEIAHSSGVRQRMETAGQWPRPMIGPADSVHITVDRTESLDHTADALRTGRVTLPGPHTSAEMQELIRHCANNVRRPEMAADGTPRYRWVSTGPNDYFHALNYAYIAAEEGDIQARLSRVIHAPVVAYVIPQRKPDLPWYLPRAVHGRRRR